MSFRYRSTATELLDQDNIPFPHIARNMKELNTINTWLGGHAITVKGFQKLAAGKTGLDVCEIGCGGGDNLVAIANYTGGKNRIKLIGIDIKEECIAYASNNNALQGAELITSDYRDVEFRKKPDIIFSSLFCHHFSEQQLVEQLRWMKNNCSVGFFINDLHRHPLAYYSIQAITQLFSSSYLVKHDAPLSVLRGFKKNELLHLCRQAGLWPVELRWKWAFRYLLIFRHG